MVVVSGVSGFVVGYFGGGWAWCKLGCHQTIRIMNKQALLPYDSDCSGSVFGLVGFRVENFSEMTLN